MKARLRYQSPLTGSKSKKPRLRTSKKPAVLKKASYYLAAVETWKNGSMGFPKHSSMKKSPLELQRTCGQRSMSFPPAGREPIWQWCSRQKQLAMQVKWPCGDFDLGIVHGLAIILLITLNSTQPD